MAFKSLLVVLTGASEASEPLDAAIGLARAEEAHLDVLCLGIDRTQVDVMGIAGGGVIVHASLLDQVREASDKLAAEATARLQADDIRWSVEKAIAPMGNIGQVVGQYARFADLLISSPPLGPRGGSEDEAVVEAALFDGRIPVLITPKDSKLPVPGLHVMIGWNDGDEALAAVRAALPVLRGATEVSIVVIDPPVYGAGRSDPGGALAQMLARHGVPCNILVLAKGPEPVAETLLRQARESAADMIVMGAYGHSRLRETLLGGATRDMLQKANLPVLMAR